MQLFASRNSTFLVQISSLWIRQTITIDNLTEIYLRSKKDIKNDGKRTEKLDSEKISTIIGQMEANKNMSQEQWINLWNIFITSNYEASTSTYYITKQKSQIQ